MVAEQIANLAARMQAMDNVLDSHLRAMEGMIAAVTDRIPQIMGALDANTSQHEALFAKSEKQAGELTELHDESFRLNERVSEAMQAISEEKGGLLASLDAEFQRHKMALGEVVNQAKDTFEELRGNMLALHGNTDSAFSAF